MRIGIYGDWGEGKTSVLKMIDEELTEKEHICVWITPWLGKTTEDIWDQLLTSVAEQLDIKTRKLAGARSAGAQLDNLRGASSSHWISKIADGLLGERLQRSMQALAKAQRESVAAEIDSKLGTRKIVVFVDDLDRTDQAIVPKLLMSLREIFDIPDFYYVLAVSPKVIEAGIESVGLGGERPKRFLEKIVELPVYLPKLSDEAITRFIDEGIDAIRQDVNSEALRTIVPLMPRNPRRIKLLLRHIASLSGQLNRYRVDEMPWRKLYLTQILRLEFPNESRLLAEDVKVISDMEYGQLAERSRARSGTSDATPRGEDRYAPQEAEDRTRFMELCEAIRETGGDFSDRYGLKSMLELIERPPTFTLREIDEVFAEFILAESHEEKVAIVEKWMGKLEGDAPDYDRSRAVFDAALLIRESQLDQAIEATTQEELLEFMANVKPATELVDLLVDNLDIFGTQLLGADAWVKLYMHALKWSRFHRQPEFKEARQDERRLVELSAGRLKNNARLDVFDSRPFDEHSALGGEASEFTRLAQKIGLVLSATVVDELLSHFEAPGGLEQFWAIDLRLRGKWLLFDRVAAFHKPNSRRRLIRLLNQAPQRKIVQSNAYTYLRMLLYGALKGGSFSMSDCRELLKDSAFVKRLWKAAVSRPLNPRTAGSLRANREQMLEMGLREETLPLPRWWRRLERTFFVAPPESEG
jgi:KAP family P-loop domain